VKGSAYAVEEFAKALAIEIVLDVAVIGAIEDVEHAESDPRALFLNGQPDFAQNLQIGGDKPGEARVVSRPNKLAILINRRVRKSGVEIEHWRDGKFPGRSNFAPGQNSIRSVKVETTTLIGLDHRLRIISEELVEVVQIAKRSERLLRAFRVLP